MSIALVVAAPVLAAGLGGGGSTIANAPEVRLAQQIVSGTTNRIAGYCNWGDGWVGEFWRVTMRSGDRLVVDFGSTDGDEVVMNVLPPSVTDYTMNEYKGDFCRMEVETGRKAQLRFTAPLGGRYTMIAQDSSPFDSSVAYEMTVRVLSFTTTSLTGPRVAGPRRSVVFRGRVTGVSGGKVEVQTAKPRGGWKSVALVRLQRNGSFTWRTRTSAPGTYRVRAIYHGDDSHLASASRIATLRVVG